MSVLSVAEGVTFESSRMEHVARFETSHLCQNVARQTFQVLKTWKVCISHVSRLTTARRHLCIKMSVLRGNDEFMFREVITDYILRLILEAVRSSPEFYK